MVRCPCAPAQILLPEFVLQEAWGELVILRFLIKAVGYVFGLIMRVWRGGRSAARLGSGAGRKETLPSPSFSLETLPGPHQRSPSFSATFLPPRLLPQCAVFPARRSLQLQDMLNKHGSKTALPTLSLYLPVLLRHRRKITATFFRCEVQFTLSSLSTEMRFVSDGSFFFLFFAEWNKIEGSPGSCCSTGGEEPRQSHTTASHELSSSSDGAFFFFFFTPKCLYANNILWS